MNIRAFLFNCLFFGSNLEAKEESYETYSRYKLSSNVYLTINDNGTLFWERDNVTSNDLQLLKMEIKKW